ncbi:MAG: hypothetical protein CL772_04485 [Chloroflexi bacterium]|nr:hypothetical protein [Chloroflexota bacterium]|tara:strand:+ start:48439 stop:48993 length:555 start_codon:yes stop_codon:yes gene_type:complete
MQNCYYHKNKETVLTCSRCNKPICNDCTSDSLVGIKCIDCGSIGKPDILNVSIKNFFTIIIGSLIFSIFSSFLYSFLIVIILNIDILGNIQSTAIMFLKVITLILLVLFGVLNAELIIRISRKKINKTFPIISAITTLSYWIFIYLFFSSIFASYQVWWYQFFYQPVAMLGLGLSIYLSYSRVK